MSMSGPVIDHGTGTILHPQKVKKERLPLAELLTGLPKYNPSPSGGSTAVTAAEKEKKVILRNEDVLSRSTRGSKGARPMTTYDEALFKQPAATAAATGSYRHMEGQQPPPPPPPPPMTSSDVMMRSEAAARPLLASTPSENSIDDSVKSAQAIGKEVLEKYLEKLKTASAAAATPGGHFWYQDQDPLFSSGKEHAMSLVRPSASGFSPYYASIPPPPPTSTSTTAHHQLLQVGGGARGATTHSSPRFSSPPPSAHDVMMMSPITDFRSSENR